MSTSLPLTPEQVQEIVTKNGYLSIEAIAEMMQDLPELLPFRVPDIWNSGFFTYEELKELFSMDFKKESERKKQIDSLAQVARIVPVKGRGYYLYEVYPKAKTKVIYDQQTQYLLLNNILKEILRRTEENPDLFRVKFHEKLNIHSIFFTKREFIHELGLVGQMYYIFKDAAEETSEKNWLETGKNFGGLSKTEVIFYFKTLEDRINSIFKSTTNLARKKSILFLNETYFLTPAKDGDKIDPNLDGLASQEAYAAIKSALADVLDDFNLEKGKNYTENSLRLAGKGNRKEFYSRFWRKLNGIGVERAEKGLGVYFGKGRLEKGIKEFSNLGKKGKENGGKGIGEEMVKGLGIRDLGKREIWKAVVGV